MAKKIKRWFIGYKNGKIEIRYAFSFVRKLDSLGWLVVSVDGEKRLPETYDKMHTQLEWGAQFYKTQKEAQIDLLLRERFS